MDLRDQLQHALGSPYRKVAVRVLRPELAPALGADRFIREIRIAARLRHPHILPLLDPGQAEGRAPVHEAVRLLVEITDALAFIVFSSGMAPYQTPVVGRVDSGRPRRRRSQHDLLHAAEIRERGVNGGDDGAVI
jgi:hypothetical protein